MASLPPAIAQACSGLPETGYGPGHEVIVQGAPGGTLFILIDGLVKVVRDQVEVASIDEPGAVFGEMSLLLGLPHTAGVVAARESRLFVIDDGAAFMAANPEIMLHVSRMLALRVQLLSGYLADLKTQFADHDSHLGMVHDILCGLCQQPHSDVTLGSDRLPGPRT
jgi:CRP-like cAMP-binding protein